MKSLKPRHTNSPPPPHTLVGGARFFLKPPTTTRTRTAVTPADVDNAGGFGMESGVTITVWSRREFGRFLLRARADARRQQMEAKERDKKKSRRSLNSLSEEEMIRKALEQSLQ